MGHHEYQHMYHTFLHGLRLRPTKLLEIGLVRVPCTRTQAALSLLTPSPGLQHEQRPGVH